MVTMNGCGACRLSPAESDVGQFAGCSEVSGALDAIERQKAWAFVTGFGAIGRQFYDLEVAVRFAVRLAAVGLAVRLGLASHIALR